MANQLQHICRQIANLQEDIEKRIAPLRNAFAKFVTALPAIVEAARPFVDALRKLPDEGKQTLKYLVERGWYLPYTEEQTLSDLLRIMNMVAANEHEKIEMLMQEYAESRTDAVRLKLGAAWPHRAFILSDAFEAHENGLYTLSIPVMLAQCDGICWELLDNSMFAKRRGHAEPKTRRALQVFLEDNAVGGNKLRFGIFDDVFLEPLRVISSVNEYAGDVKARQNEDPTYGPLNRHGVLHGLDHNYATRGNSLRPILMLDYLCLVKKILDEHSALAKETAEMLDTSVESQEP